MKVSWLSTAAVPVTPPAMRGRGCPRPGNCGSMPIELSNRSSPAKTFDASGTFRAGERVLSHWNDVRSDTLTESRIEAKLPWVARITGGGGKPSSGVPKMEVSLHQNRGRTVPTRFA